VAQHQIKSKDYTNQTMSQMLSETVFWTLNRLVIPVMLG